MVMAVAALPLIQVPTAVNGKFLFNLRHSLKVIVMLGILMPVHIRHARIHPYPHFPTSPANDL